jgi:1,4-alpha-glucan branching enzyme
MIIKGPTTQSGKVRVTFELPSTMWAERVNLVGEFNDWDTRSLPMTRNRDEAKWRVTIDLEPGCQYRFRYLVDGKQWYNDWHADDYAENPYGSDDSIVEIPAPESRIQAADAEPEETEPA